MPSPGGGENAPPSTEPTNPDTVRLFVDYLPDGLLGKIPQIVAALDDVIVPRFNPEATVDGPGLAVNENRKKMSALLKHAAFNAVHDALFGKRNVRVGVRDALMVRDFARASSELKVIEDTDAPGGGLGEATIRSALKDTPTEYTVDLPVGPPFRQSMPAYEGPELTTTQVFQLSDYTELIAGGAERSFRLPLLRAEIMFGQRNLGGALGRYKSLLTLEGLDTARRRLVAIKLALTRIELGDRTYRSASLVTDEIADTARAYYDAALAVLDQQGISSTHPARLVVADRVRQGKAQLNAGYNALGMRDSFVPVQRYTELRTATVKQIEACRLAVNGYESDVQRADDELLDRFDVEAERTAEETAAKIAAVQTENATLDEQKTTEKVAMIEAQRSFLIAQTVLSGAGTIVQAAASGGVSPQAVMGVASSALQFAAQNNELGHQLAMARLEQEIAGNQIDIAELQQKQVRDRISYLDRKASFLEGKRMSAEFLYERAAFRERLVMQRLELCTFMAYLCERALAFFFGDPDLKYIRFDYLDTKPDVATALDQLEQDFDRMVADGDTNQEAEPGSGFVEPLSLRENYPLQFQQFLQSDDGHMDFVYSLYQLSKVRPATHHCRLFDVVVEAKGLVPVGKLRGTLKHSGRFLLRDRGSTVGPPPATRLVPTEAELEQALETQRAQGTAAAAVGGVLFYTLPDDDVLDLSLAPDFVPPPPRGDEITLDTFQGYGPTGLWSLQVDDHKRLELTDIVLHFVIVNRESDPDVLRPRVRQLVEAYEAELQAGDDFDRVDVLSLRQAFPDAFLALEGGGPATVELDADLFAPDITDLQFKAVVVLAVDEDDDGLPGIGVVVRRDDAGFVRERVTGPGGFSEDLSGPLEELGPDERFPLLGSWQVALTDPSQFGQLGDLRLLFLYAYTEN